MWWCKDVCMQTSMCTVMPTEEALVTRLSILPWILHWNVEFVSPFLLSPAPSCTVPPMATFHLFRHYPPHLRFNLGATHLLILTPFATSWWLPCHQHLMSCKATSQTHSPDQTFCKLQSTTHSFSFNPLSFQLFLFSCDWTLWERVTGSSSKLHPLQVCFHLSLFHFFKQLFAESRAFYSSFFGGGVLF